jgi:hypothetical protein
VTVIATVLAATGIAAGAGATTGQLRPAVPQVSLAYACAFPSGQQPVSVLARAVYPAAATAGQPIQPSHAGVTLTLRHQAAAALIWQQAVTVTAVARLTTMASQHHRSVTSIWPHLVAPSASVPAKGSVTLTASGVAPPVTAASPGEVTFTAAGLALLLTLHHGGAATMVEVIRVRCTLKPGQDATLATVPVAAAPSPSKPGHRGSHKNAGKGTNFCAPLKKALQLNPRFPPPKPPPGSSALHSPGLPPYCAYVAGYSDVQKLKESAFLGPAFSNISPFLNSYFNTKGCPNCVFNYFQQDSAGELLYDGQRQFPPAQATFLAFGFVPATATMHLMEVGTVNIVTVGPAIPSECHQDCATVTTVSSRVFLRVDDVKINGVPLNVGPQCQTPPFNVIVNGSNATTPPYNFTTGGPLLGTVTIPQFSGCGVGENIDPIFNASISGPGNFTLLTQGVVCQNSGGKHPIGCPPEPPKPVLRHVSG